MHAATRRITRPFERRPQAFGQRAPERSPTEPLIARLAAEALVAYLARDDAVPTWALAGREQPTSSDCDALYEALGLTGALTVTVSDIERQSRWSDATFLRQVGEILGRFEFVDSAGRPLSGPGDPDVRAARFVPADADQVVASLVDRWPEIFLRADGNNVDPFEWAVRLWRCAAAVSTRQPSEAYRTARVAARASVAQQQTALNRYAVDVGRVRIVTARNEALFLQQPPAPQVAVGPDAPPLDYYLQEINGDGACFYRSIASALFQRLTGINLGRGATFSTDVQSGSNGAWATEYYGGLIQAGRPANDALALLLNGLTKWVKFYVYLVMCSDDIPAGAVSFAQGVTGVARIRPMTSVQEMAAPGAVDGIMGLGAPSTEPAVYRPPTLDLAVRYVLWLYEALSRTIVDGRQTLSWNEVRPYALPLLAIPWDAAGPQRVLPADKTIVFHDCEANSTTAVDLGTLLRDSSTEYLAALAAGGDVDAAYRAYCDAMRQSVRWGGAAEAYAFASILLPDVGSPTLGSVRGIVIFNYADPAQATALVPQIVPSKPAVDPDTGLPERRDYRADCLAVLYAGSHYVALHGVRQTADGGVAPFTPPLAPDAVEPFITVDGTQPAPPARIEPLPIATPAYRAPTTMIPRSPTAGVALAAQPVRARFGTVSGRAVFPAAASPRRTPFRGAPSPARAQPPLAPIASTTVGGASRTQQSEQIRDAARLLAALADDVADTGVPVDLLRDSAELREQFRGVARASELPDSIASAVWNAFARGAG